MSIAFQTVSEAAISGQELTFLESTLPGSEIYIITDSNIKEVRQKWPDELEKNVFNGLRIL